MLYNPRCSPTLPEMWGAGSSGGGAATGALIGLVIVLAFFGCLGWIVSSIAGKKGRSRVGWFVLGACFFIPALVGALLLKPNHDQELRSWVANGGKLCDECREPLNFGAIRCRHCGAQQSERAPEAPNLWAPATVGSGVRAEIETHSAATRFFDEQLTNVLESSITGTATMDVRALLNPIGFNSRLSTERAQTRAQKLVDEAMMFAGTTTGWVAVDDVTVPRSWAAHYRVLADTDANAPALVAFIERSAHASADVPSASLIAARDSGVAEAPASEIVYDLAGWTRSQVAAVTAALDARGTSWELDGDELIVAPGDEDAVDALVMVITGERPDSGPNDIRQAELPPPTVSPAPATRTSPMPPPPPPAG